MTSLQAILEGNRLAISRLLTEVENDLPHGRAVLDELFPYTGKAHLVGITGSPGTGKSSLANQLAKSFRNPPAGREAVKVAVVAVDPSSPFTGGAILGDRVRMRDLSGDPGVFIRSMAARGTLGGLARTTAAVVQVLDAAGFELILVETVGAGQSEVDIATLAHTTVVVEAPGMGDDIQAIKAGILEIADILVVNKADRPGAENTERALRTSLEMAHPTRPGSGGPDSEWWMPPVLKTEAANGVGIEAVANAVLDHRAYLHRSGQWAARERSRLERELGILIQGRLLELWRSQVGEEQYRAMLEKLFAHEVSPFQASDGLLETIKGKI